MPQTTTDEARIFIGPAIEPVRKTRKKRLTKLHKATMPKMIVIVVVVVVVPSKSLIVLERSVGMDVQAKGGKHHERINCDWL